MDVVMAAADVVLCRAGASTISELTALGKPTVMVPSPYVTNNHQEKNARLLEKHGGAVVITEPESTGDGLYKAVEAILSDNEKRTSHGPAMKELGIPDATARIYDTVMGAGAEVRESPLSPVRSYNGIAVGWTGKGGHMRYITIEGGTPLRGEVAVQGAKNSVLPILAATLLSGDVCRIEGCPHLSDVDSAADILRYLGCAVQWDGDDLLVDSTTLTRCDIPQTLMRRMRSSVIFLGAILARCGWAELSYPGGCELGRGHRPAPGGPCGRWGRISTTQAGPCGAGRGS